MKNENVEFKIEGINITVITTNHAKGRMSERNITKYQVASAIMALGEEILDFKTGTEFVIIDEELDAAYAYAIHTEKSGEIFIDIVTVLDTKDMYVKRGVQVLKLETELRK